MEFDFISVKEAAEKVGVTECWIQQLCKAEKSTVQYDSVVLHNSLYLKCG